MDILLIAGPVIEPTQPALAIPTLAAYLRSKGFDVYSWDLNIECFNFLLSELFLRHSLERINHRDFFGNEHDMQKYRRAVLKAELLGQIVVDKIEEAKRILRDNELFYKLDCYKNAFCILSGAYRIINAAYFPTHISFKTYDINEGWAVPQIMSHLSDVERNIFLNYFDASIIPRIQELDPPLIALSVTYESQFLPCLTLCKLLQNYAPDIPVILGGAYITTVSGRLKTMEFIWDLVTGIVLYEGESALAEICDRVRDGKDLSAIPNLFLKSGKSTINGIIHREKGGLSGQIHLEDIKNLPPPDFSGFPLEQYLVPEPVLPVQSSRGCYWGKCAFCAVSIATRQSFRQRSLMQFINDLHSIHAATGATMFSLCNDATPVKYMKGLAQCIISRELPYLWATEARLEPGLDQYTCHLIADGGCRHLLFGFESASDRVLSLMRKGTVMEETIRILEECKNANIGVTLYSFLGFPGETVKEARMTGEFFKAHKDLYTNVTLTTFSAMLGSEIVRHPERYQVTIKYDQNVLARDCKIEVGCGMSTEEAHLQLETILQDLYQHDVAVNQFFNIYGTAHWLLYLSKFGRVGINSLWETYYIVHEDLNKTYLAASRDIRFQVMSEKEEVIYNSSGCLTTISIDTAKAVRLLQHRPQLLSAIAFQTVGEHPRDDKITHELLLKLMFELFILVKQKFLFTVRSHEST